MVSRKCSKALIRRTSHSQMSNDFQTLRSKAIQFETIHFWNRRMIQGVKDLCRIISFRRIQPKVISEASLCSPISDMACIQNLWLTLRSTTVITICMRSIMKLSRRAQITWFRFRKQPSSLLIKTFRRRGKRRRCTITVHEMKQVTVSKENKKSHQQLQKTFRIRSCLRAFHHKQDTRMNSRIIIRSK